VVTEDADVQVAGFPRYTDITNRPSDYRDYATHYVQIDHRVVTSATTATAVVTTNLLGLYLSTIAASELGKKIDGLNFSKSKLKVKIVIQGAPYAAGQIVACFVPNVGGSNEFTIASGPGVIDKVNCKIVPHLILDPSKTQTYEIILPVCTPTGVWSLFGLFGSYSMNFVYLNPIFSGTAVAASIAVCSYAAFETESLEGLTLLSNDFVEEKNSTLSSLVSNVGRYAPLLSVPFPSLSPGITLFSKVASGIGDLLARLGYSKPPVTEITTVPMTRHVDNFSQNTGKSNAIVLAASQGNSVGLSSAYGGGTDDEMLLINLCKKKGLVIQTSVAPAAATGTLVWDMRLHPTYMGSGFGTGGLKVPTPLAGVAVPFNYWTGDLIVTIEVVASVFHRCTLLAAWDAVSADVPFTPTMAQSMQSLPNTVITVAGNTSVELRIPWAQSRLWGDVASFTTTQTSPTIPSYMTNGSLYIFVVNSLVSNGSSDSIPINIYLSSDNIAFAAPEARWCPRYTYITTGIPPASFADGDDDGLDELPLTLLSNDCIVECVPVSFGPKTDLKHALQRSFGEEYTSVKHLTSKMTMTSTSNAAAISDLYSRGYYFNTPQPWTTDATTAEGTTQYQSYLGWFSAAYLGYRGSIRHAFHPWSSTVDAVAYEKHMFLTNLSTGPKAASALTANITMISQIFNFASGHYAFTMGNRELAPTMDGVCPTLIPYDFIPRGGVSEAKNHIHFTVKNVASGNPTARFDHITGSGDDASFVWFLGFPPVV